MKEIESNQQLIEIAVRNVADNKLQENQHHLRQSELSGSQNTLKMTNINAAH